MAEETNDKQQTTEEAHRRRAAVITGASSGIGYATAVEFARQGYNVALTARRTAQLKEVAEQCEQHGVKALSVAADTTDVEALQKVADGALKQFGHIDVWVNGAAVSMYGKFLEAPLEDFKQVIDTNLIGYVNGSKIALGQFKNQGHGTLINISSVNAVAPVPYSSAYVTSKYAIRGLDESLRMEFDLEGLSDKIHICTVMPSSVDTNLFQNAANYTEQEIEALEPVYDPEYVAKQIVRLTEKPKREMIIGPAGKMMAGEFSMMPRLYEKTMARFVKREQLGKSHAAVTKGNLYDSVEGNTGMRGGWRETRMRADRLNIILGATTAAVAIGAAAASYMRARQKRQPKGLLQTLLS